MRNFLLIIVLSIFWCTVSFAKDFNWIRTDYNTNYYLKNGWTLKFVNSFKGWHNDETIYTFQKQNMIVSCKVRNFREEACHKPEN